MHDEQIQRRPYLKLLLLAALLGIASAGMMFVFEALVNGGQTLIWQQAAQATGLPQPVFTLLVCTLGGLVVGGLVKIFGDQTGIFAELLAEFGRTGRFDYRHAPGIVITALASLLSGASLDPEAPLADACGGLGTLAADKLKLTERETRALGYSGFSGMLAALLTSPFGGALLSIETARERADYVWGHPHPGLVSLWHGRVCAVHPIIFRHTVCLSGLRAHATTPSVGGTAGPGRRAGRRDFHHRIAWTAPDHAALEKPPDPARPDRRAGPGHRWSAATLDAVFGRDPNRRADQPGAAAQRNDVDRFGLATGWKGGYIFPTMFAGTALGLAVHAIFPGIPMAVTVAATMAGALVAIVQAPARPAAEPAKTAMVEEKH